MTEWSAVERPPNNLVGIVVLLVWLVLGAALAADVAFQPLTFAFVMTGWILAVMAHEFAHAAIAYLGGDVSVREKGYLGFDPRRYGDLGTTLVIPLLALALGGIGFPGGAVYLDTNRMRGPFWRAAASLAGPTATLLVLLILAYGLALYGPLGALGALYPALAMLAFLQATALILNLLPVPGLDGFNAIRPFLPFSVTRAIARFEGMALIALLAALLLLPGVGALLFGAASELAVGLGVPRSAIARGLEAFRFWA